MPKTKKKSKKKKSKADTNLGQCLSDLYEQEKDFSCIHTGSTLLDLALAANSVDGTTGFVRKRVAQIYGKESSGKTLVCLSTAGCFHEQEPKGDVYINDVENALDVHWAVETFGLNPKRTYIKNSKTVEQMEQHVLDVCARAKQKKRPALYVLDSLDALETQMAKENVKKRKKAAEKKRKEEGEEEDFDKRNMRERLEKAQLMYSFFESVVGNFKKDDITFLIISQAKIDPTKMFGDKETTSGGGGPKFFSTHRLLIKDIGKLSKKVGGKRKTLGVKTRCKVVKNKVQEPLHFAEFPIYYMRGIDDVRSCVEFLIDMKVLNKKSLQWKSKTFKSQKKLIAFIKRDDRKINKLKKMTRKTWMSKMKLTAEDEE